MCSSCGVKWKHHSIRQDDIRLHRRREFIAGPVDDDAAPNLGDASEGIGRIEPKAQLRSRELMPTRCDPISLSGRTSGSRAVI